MIRVILTDDHPILRKGLRQLLEEQADISIVAEAGNGNELMEKLANCKCDLIVLDISMPGRNGLDVLRQLRQDYQRIPVLVLSMHPEEQYAVRAIRSGASGYMTKESAPDELVKAVRKIHGGGRYVSESLAERLLIEVASPVDIEPHTLLSDREFQILCLIGEGNTISAIADKLCISVKTVSTYRSRILLKMNMKNNAELAKYAIKKGLVES